MVKEDFLVNNEMTEVEKAEKLFEFSDYSSDETETLIDSNEDLSEEEFLTPIQFTSQFGKKQAALSTSTPNLSIKRPYRRPSKRSASSPASSPGQEGTSKRTKTKSKLPTIKKK